MLKDQIQTTAKSKLFASKENLNRFVEKIKQYKLEQYFNNQINIVSLSDPENYILLISYNRLMESELPKEIKTAIGVILYEDNELDKLHFYTAKITNPPVAGGTYGYAFYINAAGEIQQ